MTFPSSSRLRRTVACLSLLAALAAPARADERMNGMVGLFYSTTNLVGFEYDLIYQFKKSVNWMGNFTGPYLAEEATWRTNKFGGGFVVGSRREGKGSYAGAVTFFAENRWDDFSEFRL